MKHLALSVVLVLIPVSAIADTAEEILAAVQEEQAAFKDGDCDKVELMLSEDLTFYANGRKMSHKQVGDFCRSIRT